MLADALGEGRRHVDADRGDLPGRGVVRLHMGGELLDGGGVPAFGNEHDLALFGGGHERQTVVPALIGGLVDSSARHVGQINLGQSQFDVALADRVYAMPRLTDGAGHGGKRHLLGECRHHRLEQQREAAELAGPTGFDERDAAIGLPHARRAHFEITVMLEKFRWR